MDTEKTQVDRWIESAKNHKVLSVIIFGAIILGGVASVSDSVGKILKPILGQTKNAKSQLTRLDSEIFLQANRGNIERCLNALPTQYYYVDFVFSPGPSSTIDVDILAELEASDEIESKQVENYAGHDVLWLRSLKRDTKLSVIAPGVNGCIIRSLNEKLNKFQIDHLENSFVHRYITDSG